MACAKTSWHLLGAGSIGCLFAAYLRRADIDVQLLLRDRSAVAEFTQVGGLRLHCDQRSKPIAIAAHSLTSLSEPVQNILLCTKAPQALTALQAIRYALAPQPLLILFQNGIGLHELLQREFPQAIIINAVSTEGAYQQTRFHVVHAGRGTTVLGAIDSTQQAFAEQAASALHCGLPIAAVPDIETRLWLKLAINSVINPLTALHECRNGELLQLPNSDLLITELCSEFAAIAAAQQTLTVPKLLDHVYRVIRETAANRSSMLQDIEQRRHTENEFISGFIVQSATRQRIDCPQHQRLYAAISAKERQLGCR